MHSSSATRPAAPGPGETNCGTTATKNTPAFGFSAMLINPSRKGEPERSRGSSTGFRRWALGLALILALPFNVGSLFIAVPEIFAATLAYVLIGLTVQRAPRN